MKTDEAKCIKDEIWFVVISTISLIVLSLIIFPLFIALLPLVLIAGCKEIWSLDHMNRRHENQRNLM